MDCNAFAGGLARLDPIVPSAVGIQNQNEQTFQGLNVQIEVNRSLLVLIP